MYVIYNFAKFSITLHKAMSRRGHHHHHHGHHHHGHDHMHYHDHDHSHGHWYLPGHGPDDMEENEHEYINGRCVNCGEPEFPQGGHHVGQIVNGRCTNCGERHPSARNNRSTRNNRDNRRNRSNRNNQGNQNNQSSQNSQNSQNSRNNQNSRPDADMGQRLRDELQRWQNLHATARLQNRDSYLFCDEHMRYHFGDNYAHFTPAQYMDMLATAVAIGGEQQNGASNNENRDPHSNWDHDGRQGH
ncbi:hypothetical protein M434DRAFT_32491 [Hypoxylon sp. CO27-5]|nr:hypothetical protein M434DRAFT_32491 [Hypoxylon sp. CO27-5]